MRTKRQTKKIRKTRKTKNKRTIYGGSARSPSRSRSPASRAVDSRSTGMGRGASVGASYRTFDTIMEMFGFTKTVRTREDDIVEHVGVIWIAFIYYLYIKLEHRYTKFHMGIVYELEGALIKDKSTDQSSRFDALQKVFDSHGIDIDVRRQHDAFLEDKGDAIQGALEKYPKLKKGYK